MGISVKNVVRALLGGLRPVVGLQF